jgi:sulfatase maturation enzyme AslB (radical SAM superfamily)
MSGKKNSIPAVNLSGFSKVEKLTLVVTKGCNMKCDYCYEKHFPEQKMDVADAFRHIEETDPTIIKFFGGEPLLNRRLIAQVMDSYPDKYYEVITNGTYIDKLDEKYWKQFNVIYISLDGNYENDPTRWSSFEEYTKVINNIKWLASKVGSEKLIFSTTLDIRKAPDYSIIQRVEDIFEISGATKFDINIVMFDGDNNYVMTEDIRNKFLYWCMEANLASIKSGGQYDIGLNEAVFSTKQHEMNCCNFRSKKQLAVDVNGFSSACHVAAYYNLDDDILNELNETTDAACIILEAMANKAGITVPLDTENFATIAKAENINRTMYYAQPNRERFLCRS